MISIVSNTRAIGELGCGMPVWQDAGVLGIWFWDVAANRLFADGAFAGLFSVDPEQAARGAPVEAFVDGIMEDDRQRVADAVRSAVRAAGDFACEYRLMTPQGLRWIAAYARCHATPEGRVGSYVGVAIDITAKRKQPDESHLDRIAEHTLAACSIAANHGEDYIQHVMKMALFEVGSRLAQDAPRPESGRH